MSVLCIADSNELDQRIIKLNLIRYPVFKHVLYFYDGAPLIKYLGENRNDKSNLPDVILIDLSISQGNGLTVLDALNAIYPKLSKELSVYIISASINPAGINKALAYPFVKDFMAKPVTRHALAAISEGNKVINYR